MYVYTSYIPARAVLIHTRRHRLITIVFTRDCAAYARAAMHDKHEGYRLYECSKQDVQIVGLAKWHTIDYLVRIRMKCCCFEFRCAWSFE